jgi:hypothetical protein
MPSVSVSLAVAALSDTKFPTRTCFRYGATKDAFPFSLEVYMCFASMLIEWRESGESRRLSGRVTCGSQSNE